MKEYDQKTNNLYTTVTLLDFNDSTYINKLIELDIGMELALLTNLSDITNFEKDLDLLKKEIISFKKFFDQFKINISNIRVHQPGGYSYYWFGDNKLSGYDFLRQFFSYCYDLGFRNYVIHSPYGNSNVDRDLELNDYREKLSNLINNADLEVEEIDISNNELKKNKYIRFYRGMLFEQLMDGQKSTILLDVYECGGVNKTIQRIKDLEFKKFKIKSIHLHKDKHKFLSNNEVKILLDSKFSGNIINEGFICEDSSFNEFAKTKSISCVVLNDKRIDILYRYKKEIK